MSETGAGKQQGICYGPLVDGVVHLCVDMQRLFAEDTPWKTPWMAKVAPNVVALSEAHPDRTVFTRFMPANDASQARGAWKRYWKHWPDMTMQALGPEMTELVPELRLFIPPAMVIDKPSLYSPWATPALKTTLDNLDAHTLVISGGETDVCVLATVLGAVDLGYRTIVVTDALCSSSDETHDALMKLYGERFSQQVETTTTAEVLSLWTHR